jgi:hypothetical protein
MWSRLKKWRKTDDGNRSFSNTVCASPPHDVCSICLDGYDPTAKNQMHTACGHCFHQECIAHALKTSHKCPNCRTELPDTTAHAPGQSSPPSIQSHLQNMETAYLQMVKYLYCNHTLLAILVVSPIVYAYIACYVAFKTCKLVAYSVGGILLVGYCITRDTYQLCKHVARTTVLRIRNLCGADRARICPTTTTDNLDDAAA